MLLNFFSYPQLGQRPRRATQVEHLSKDVRPLRRPHHHLLVLGRPGLHALLLHHRIFLHDDIPLRRRLRHQQVLIAVARRHLSEALGADERPRPLAASVVRPELVELVGARRVRLAGAALGAVGAELLEGLVQERAEAGDHDDDDDDPLFGKGPDDEVHDVVCEMAWVSMEFGGVDVGVDTYMWDLRRRRCCTALRT